MDSLVMDILNWLHNSEDRVIVGVSGHGAAGKTTFVQQLPMKINQEDVGVLNTDPYIISSEVRKHSLLNYAYQDQNYQFKMTACHPAAHHLPSLERDIQMLQAGLDICTINTHYEKSKRISGQNKIIIVEGMSAAFLNPALFDLKIYFYTDDETEFARRLNRDITERGTKLQYLRDSHKQRRLQYYLFMHPYHKQFDIIVKTTNQTMSIQKWNLP